VARTARKIAVRNSRLLVSVAHGYPRSLIADRSSCRASQFLEIMPEDLNAASACSTYVLMSLLTLTGCSYDDAAFRPDSEPRATPLNAAYKSLTIGKTTRGEAEQALGRSYCTRNLRDGDVELRWGGPMTRVRRVHFLGIETRRYAAHNSWAFALILHQDVVVQKKDVVVNGIDGSEPCVETCPECFATAALPLTHGGRAQDSSLDLGIAKDSIVIDEMDGHD